MNSFHENTMQKQIIQKNHIYSTALVFVIGILIFSALSNPAYASQTDGTITSGGNEGYAWSDQAGWMNFGVANGNIHITDSGITGYAWSNNYGWINMAPTNGGVTIAASGVFSGYAWGSGLGWINFSGVSINSSGKFVGQASGSIIGTLAFDCTNCSIATDYRPQNFRTTVTPPPSSGGGGGGGGGGTSFVSGPGGQAVPAHIDAFNVPLKLFPAQSGILTQNLTNQKSVILDAPSNIYSDDVIFVIGEKTISGDIVTPNISVISNALFDVTAWDKANNPVHSFLKPIKITFTIPELLRGRADLGVYFFDDAASVWVKIPDTVFSGDTVSFSVSHLTLFAILSAAELPPTIAPPFPLPAELVSPVKQPAVQSPQGKTPASEVTPASPAGGSKEAPPLFDVQISPGPTTSKNNSAYYIIAIVLTVLAGIAFYIFRRWKKRKYEDEI